MRAAAGGGGGETQHGNRCELVSTGRMRAGTADPRSVQQSPAKKDRTRNAASAVSGEAGIMSGMTTVPTSMALGLKSVVTAT